MEHMRSADADLIARARSVVMAHHHVDASDAMELLRRLSVRRCCPVRQVAQEVVDRRRRPLAAEPGELGGPAAGAGL